METTLIIIVVCLIISAFFSASEMAFSSLNRVRIKSMAEQGDGKAQMVLKMLDKYDDLLSTILVRKMPPRACRTAWPAWPRPRAPCPSPIGRQAAPRR